MAFLSIRTTLGVRKGAVGNPGREWPVRKLFACFSAGKARCAYCAGEGREGTLKSGSSEGRAGMRAVGTPDRAACHYPMLNSVVAQRGLPGSIPSLPGSGALGESMFRIPEQARFPLPLCIICSALKSDFPTEEKAKKTSHLPEGRLVKDNPFTSDPVEGQAEIKPALTHSRKKVAWQTRWGERGWTERNLDPLAVLSSFQGPGRLPFPISCKLSPLISAVTEIGHLSNSWILTFAGDVPT